MDGHAFSELVQRQEAISRQREELEKQRKQLTKKKPSSASASPSREWSGKEGWGVALLHVLGMRIRGSECLSWMSSGLGRRGSGLSCDLLCSSKC